MRAETGGLRATLEPETGPDYRELTPKSLDERR